MNLLLDRQFRLGIVFLILLGLVIAGAVAQYQGAFRDTITVTVRADRAGLTMDKAAPVKFRGVEIGDVHAIRAQDGEVEIELALDKDKVGQVPAELTAQLVPPTAFGAKYVQVTATGKDDARVRDGQVIAADHVTVEIDEAFTNLTQVLEAAQPAQVNNVLTALSGAVDQRGRKVGRLIEQAERYLGAFNPATETLASDLRKAQKVLAGYDQAMPDILDVADRLTVTSATLRSRQAQLRRVLRGLDRLGIETRDLVRSAADPLASTVDLLEPVSGVLADFSPELPCLVGGLASANELAEKAVGGTNPGVTTITRLQPSAEPYRNPENLPRVGDGRGPGCYGLPYVDAAEALQPPPTFLSGANPHTGPEETPTDDLATTFFGGLAGLVNAK